MDIWRLTVAVLRRWYILLPLLALSAFGALQAGAGVQPQYTASATAMLVPAREGSEISNPYGSLSNANEITSIVLESNESRDAIAAQGLSDQYSVSAATRGTVMTVSVTDLSPEVAMATVDAVLEKAAAELAERQSSAGIPPPAQYGMDVLQPTSIVETVNDGKLRIMAIVGVLGAALSMLVAVLFDDMVGLWKRWRRKRRERRDEKPATGETDADESDPDIDEPDVDAGKQSSADESARSGPRTSPEADEFDSRPGGRRISAATRDQLAPTGRDA